MIQQLRTVLILTTLSSIAIFDPDLSAAEQPDPNEEAQRPLTEFEKLEKEKSHYSLFNPTPKNLMREFTTDRPDKTESPYSVDAGHFQFEGDILTYAVNMPDADTTTRLFYWNQMNLKVGITNNSDLQVIVPSLIMSRTETANSTDTQKGFGDITVRYKYNIFGNEGGPTAMGIMPFVKIPTASEGLGNSLVEGGVIVPIALALPAGWSIGFMLELDKKKNSQSDQYHTEFISSLTLGHEIIENLGGYFEIWSLSSNEMGSAWIATLDAGLVLGIAENVNLDLGVNLGMTDAADDLNPFLGISFRF